MELVVSIVSQMYHKLASQLGTKNPFILSSKLLSDLENGQEDVSVNNPTINEKQGGIRSDQLIAEKDSIIETVDLVNSANLGFLIPLSCGHNGLLKPHEMEIYEYHLKKSKFI